jgi:hypothetical protein
MAENIAHLVLNNNHLLNQYTYLFAMFYTQQWEKNKTKTRKCITIQGLKNAILVPSHFLQNKINKNHM